LERDVFIWQDNAGNIGAVLNPEGTGYAYLQVDPSVQTQDLLSEMLMQAEAKLAFSRKDAPLKINIFADESDKLLQHLLDKRGYLLSNTWERHHYRSLAGFSPDVVLPDGYVVRSLGDVHELPARSYLSWNAFHSDEPDENYDGWDWYLNVQRAPLYRRDFDLVVASPEGELCSFCTIWFDDVTQVGAFEPVGTAKKFHRMGLGKAVIYEGIKRLKLIGAQMAYVGSGSKPASVFYTSIGFKEYDVSQMWTKTL